MPPAVICPKDQRRSLTSTCRSDKDSALNGSTFIDAVAPFTFVFRTSGSHEATLPENFDEVRCQISNPASDFDTLYIQCSVL